MKQQRITRTAGLALAICALVAPTAAAGTDFRSPDTRDAAAQSQAGSSQDLRSPDSRDAGVVQSNPGQVARDLRAPDTSDFASGRTVPEVTVVRVAEPAAAGGGLDWGDAGIGAGALLGLILIGAGASLMVLHRRQRQPAT